MEYLETLEVVQAIAREAGEIALSYFRSDRVAGRVKGERDVVTAADVASEEHIVRRLREIFPGDAILAEEGGAASSSNDRCWCVDPLDGTLNYSRGLPIWCVSISLFLNQIPVLGVIHDPLGGETFCAAKGCGAKVNGEAIGNRDACGLAQALVHISIDFHDDSRRAGVDDVQRLAPRVLRTRNIGAVGLALAYVAAGRLDAVLHRFAHPWDYGAGVVLIQESGGTATTIQGETYSQSSPSVLAAGNDALHRDLVALVR